MFTYHVLCVDIKTYENVLTLYYVIHKVTKQDMEVFTVKYV